MQPNRHGRVYTVFYRMNLIFWHFGRSGREQSRFFVAEKHPQERYIIM